MKNLHFCIAGSGILISFLFSPTFLVSQDSIYLNAVYYNDFLIAEQNKIGERIINFNEQISKEIPDFDKVDQAYNNLLGQVNETEITIRNLGPFKGETDIRDAAHALFVFYKSIVIKEYAEMIGFMKKESLSEDEMTRFEAIIADVTERELILDQNFQMVQDNFAKRHNFSLTNNELQKEIDD